MKKLITTTVLLAMLTAVNAQEKGQTTKATQNPAVSEQRASQRAAQTVDPLIAELGLDEGQVQKLAVVNQRHERAAAELQRSGLTGEALAARKKVLEDARDQDLRTLLTVEQYEKMINDRGIKKPAPATELKDSRVKQ